MPIPQFHAGLPANFERWPDAVFDQGKPTAQAAWALLSDLVPPFLQPVQRQAISDYLAFEASLHED